MTPDTCPHCGADLPRRARACPECGADERTGWSEDADVDRLGLPRADDFDHEEFVRNEFGKGPKPPRSRAFWGWIAAGLLGALLYWWFF